MRVWERGAETNKLLGLVFEWREKQIAPLGQAPVVRAGPCAAVM